MGKILLPTIFFVIAIFPKIIPSILATAQVLSLFLTGKKPALDEDMYIATVMTLMMTSFYLLYIAIVFKIEKDKAQKALLEIQSQEEI